MRKKRRLKYNAWVRKYYGKNGAEVDADIVGMHVMMEAAELGLGFLRAENVENLD